MKDLIDLHELESRGDGQFEIVKSTSLAEVCASIKEATGSDEVRVTLILNKNGNRAIMFTSGNQAAFVNISSGASAEIEAGSIKSPEDLQLYVMRGEDGEFLYAGRKRAEVLTY